MEKTRAGSLTPRSRGARGLRGGVAPGERNLTRPPKGGSTMGAQRLRIGKGICPETAPSALPASSSWDKAVRGNRCRGSGALLPWAAPRARSSGDSLHAKAPHPRGIAKQCRHGGNDRPIGSDRSTSIIKQR